MKLADLKISQKITIFVALVTLFIFSAFIVISTKGNTVSQSIALAQQQSVPFALIAKEMEKNVVEVQQWLTDISATRAQDGLNDGFDEAGKAREKFLQGLNKFRDWYLSSNQDQNLDSLNRLERSFEDWYQTGKRMAQGYIDGGPAVGNQLMGEFDEVALQLSEQLEAFVDESMEESNRVLALSNESIQSMIITVIIVFIGMLGFIIFMSAMMGRQLIGLATKLSESMTTIMETGDFHNRVEVSGKDEFAEMGEIFNRLLENIERALNDTNSVMDAIAKGDFKKRIAFNLQGEFARLEQGVNASADSIEKTMNTLSNVMEGLGKGDLSVRMNDDVEEVFRNQVNGAMERVDDVIQQVESLVNEAVSGDLSNRIDPSDFEGFMKRIAEAINNLMDSFDGVLLQTRMVIGQVNDSVGQVRMSSQDLASSMEEQSSAIEEVSTSLEETDSQVRSNAQNANVANQLVQETSTVADQGQVKMREMIRSMGDISGSSQEIGKIIKVIDEIAFQTNLLALNAAVEAARAGKYGKGFAVVAQEVRELAGRSAEAAKETAELIEKSTHQVSDGVKIADATAEALEGIVENVIKVRDLVAEISTASDEQTKGITQINTAISQVSEGAQSGSQQSMEMANAGDQLSSLTDQLNSEVSRFKLKEEEYVADPVNTVRVARPQNPTEGAAATTSASTGSRPHEVLSLDQDERDFGDF